MYRDKNDVMDTVCDSNQRDVIIEEIATDRCMNGISHNANCGAVSG